ncbi:Uncharacterised protein [Mycobacteroides abscessus subsp. bolletii]|nr:Uncharacterised protein [Mycobacteroides abscessus subsp. bolletii]
MVVKRYLYCYPHQRHTYVKYTSQKTLSSRVEQTPA